MHVCVCVVKWPTYLNHTKSTWLKYKVEHVNVSLLLSGPFSRAKQFFEDIAKVVEDQGYMSLLQSRSVGKKTMLVILQLSIWWLVVTSIGAGRQGDK